MNATGILLCMAGMALLCAMDAVAKALGAHLNVFQIALVRFGGAALWLALYMALTRGVWPMRLHWRRHVLRGLLMVCTACLFFYGITNLPIAIATALAMSAPIYVSLFGIVFLRERPSPPAILAILLGVAGSAVIVFGGGIGSLEGELTAWLAALLAPVAYAASIVLLKRHADDEGAAALTVSTAAVAGIALLPLALPGFVLPPIEVWPLMGVIGLLGALGFVCLTTGLKTTPASAFAVVDYTSLLWAALFGYVFFSEIPELRFWIGGGLIVVACALGTWATTRRPKVPATAAAAS